MKALLFTATIFLAGPSFAGGLSVTDDPEVVAPATAHDWTGFYFGAATRRSSTTTETVECFKLGNPRACDDPIFLTYPELKEEVATSSTSTDRATGLLIGYWHDMGRVVPGVDVAIYADTTVPGVNLGLDLGNVMPYAHYDRDGAALGVEVKMSPRLSAGIRAGEHGGALTMGWKF